MYICLVYLWLQLCLAASAQLPKKRGIYRTLTAPFWEWWCKSTKYSSVIFHAFFSSITKALPHFCLKMEREKERERERERSENWLKIGVKWGFLVFVKSISKTPSVKRRGKRRKKKVFGTLDPRLQDQL